MQNGKKSSGGDKGAHIAARANKFVQMKKIAARAVKFTNPKTNLEAAAQRFVELYDFAPIAYVSFDRVGRIEEINFAATRLLGKSRNALVGRPFAMCVSKPDTEEFLRHLLFCRTKQKRVETEVNLHNERGELIPVQLSSTPTASFLRDGALLFQTVIVDLRERKKAEADLRAREERYRTLFDLVPVAVYTCAANGNILQFNQRAAELWGRQPDRNGAQEKYCGSFRICYPDGKPMPHEKCPMARVLRGEKLEPSDLEILVERPDGVRRSVVANPKALKNEKGRIIGAINCLYDITERKMAEAELRDKKNELDLIVRQTPFMLTHCSRDLRYGYVSREYAKMAGQTPEEIAGKSIAEVMGDEGFATIRPHIEKVLTGKRADYEALVSFKNGVPRFLHATYLPDKNERGQVVGWIASLIDITDRKQAEEEVRASEEALRAILEQTNAAMGRTDLKGRLIFVNDKFCQMLGYKREELVGKTLQERTHPDDFRENMRLFKRMVTRGVPYEMEKRYIRKDGSSIWANVSASAIRNAAGKPESGVVVALDISDRKKAEKGLREAKLFLETRVRERTAELLAANEELQNEIAQRKRLEGELL
jgi:PAS domain S-box-containing protein